MLLLSRAAHRHVRWSPHNGRASVYAETQRVSGLLSYFQPANSAYIKRDGSRPQLSIQYKEKSHVFLSDGCVRALRRNPNAPGVCAAEGEKKCFFFPLVKLFNPPVRLFTPISPPPSHTSFTSGSHHRKGSLGTDVALFPNLLSTSVSVRLSVFHEPSR